MQLEEIEIRLRAVEGVLKRHQFALEQLFTVAQALTNMREVESLASTMSYEELNTLEPKTLEALRKYIQERDDVD